MSAERLFVTGATGFVGRHVVAALLDSGHKVTVGLRDATHCPAAWRNHPQVKVVETGALESATNLDDALEDASTVVHLAGLAHVRGGNETELETRFKNANAIATANLTKAARQAGVKSFINLSSIAAIGPNSSPHIIDDMTVRRPTSAYGRSKMESEDHVRKLAQAGVFAVSIRPPLIVGADAKGNWQRLQALALSKLPLPFGRVRNERSFIGIRSLVEATVLLCRSRWPAELSGEYNLADAEYLSLPAVISELRAGMGLPTGLFAFPARALALAGNMLGYRYHVAGLMGDLRVDSSRFFSTFRFEPSQGIRQAIRQSGAEYSAAQAQGKQAE